jgi:hypothetical protein
MKNSLRGKQSKAFDANSRDPKKEQDSLVTSERGSTFTSERGSTFTSERGSTLTSERGSTLTSERGSTVLEYVLGIALLFPVALGIGLSLEKVSQARGEVALEASQYLLPCTSANPYLGTVDTEECK